MRKKRHHLFTKRGRESSRVCTEGYHISVWISGLGEKDPMSFCRVLHLHDHDAPVLPVDLASFYGNSLQMYLWIIGVAGRLDYLSEARLIELAPSLMCEGMGRLETSSGGPLHPFIQGPFALDSKTKEKK
jgi:hypothetical protein